MVYPLHIVSTTGYGIYSSNWASNAEAIYGNATGTAGSGVYGRATSNAGFGLAGYSYNAGVAVGAWSYNGNLIEAYYGDYPGGVPEFYVDQYGVAWGNGGHNTFRSG